MAHEKILAALRGLGELHQAGALSAETFQRKKGHFLAQIHGLSGGGAASPMPLPQAVEAFVTGDAASSTVAAPATPKAATPAPSAARKAGERSTSPGLGGAAFVWCPPGTFRMGSDRVDEYENEEVSDSETPAREVTLTRGFWMKATPVTQAEWQALAGFNPSCFENAGPEAPVEQVSWFEAVWFCNQLSKKEGLPPAYLWHKLQGITTQGGFELLDVELVAGSAGYRLPTEAEWEYACRAGTSTPRYGGLDDIAWWGAYGNEGNAQVIYEGGRMYRGKSWGTHTVGQKQPNPWGLYDMLGNVSEWCFDVSKDSYAGLPTSDPLCTSGCRGRIARGGSWSDDARFVRSASRSESEPADRSYDTGFRLLRYS